MRRSRLINLATMAACVGAAALWPSGAQAVSLSTEIAIQANTGYLWTWTGAGAHNTGLGMMAGTSPSVAPLSGFVSDHEIAFQANTGDLWTTGAWGQGNMHLGMMAGTSPSITGLPGTNTVAFKANTGHLWITGIGDQDFTGWDRNSPSIAGSEVAYDTMNLDGHGDHLSECAWSFGCQIHDQSFDVSDGTSPSINAKAEVAFQGYNGNLFAYNVYGHDPSDNHTTSNPDTGLGMKTGTSPSINDHYDIAFQANNGDLYIIYNRGNGGGRDTGFKMMAGTSPSIDNAGDVAFQGSNGDLWLWNGPASRASDLGLGMKAGTSPSIGLDT